MQADEEIILPSFNLALLKHSVLLSSCDGKKISYRDFQFALIRNMLAHAGQELQVQIPLGGKPQQHWQSELPPHSALASSI
jgi:hypothetical protein